MPYILINPGHGCSNEYNRYSAYPNGLFASGYDIVTLPVPQVYDDCGSCGNGLQEAERCLTVGKLVAKYLLDVGYRVDLFQYDGLETICNKANANSVDLFVSIHCNAADNLSAEGCETFYYYNAPAGKKIANCIYQQIVNSIDITRRGVKEQGFYVLKYTDMPACLVEMAFISNEYDANLLKNNYDDFAKAIARGISDYFTN